MTAFARHSAFLSGVPGQTVMTRGVALLSDLEKVNALAALREFRDFTTDNDPWGEHDFGRITLHSAGRFDYYADRSCTYGAADASDPSQCWRVLTLMLASEY
jgi:hypothetical protein